MISKCTLLLVAAALAVAGPGCVRDTAMNGRFASAKAGTPSESEISLTHKPGQSRNPAQLGRTYAELEEDLQTGMFAGILRFVRRAGGSRRSQQAPEDTARTDAAGSGLMEASSGMGRAVRPASYEPGSGGNQARGLLFNDADRAGSGQIPGQIPGRAARNYTPVDPLDMNSGTVQKEFVALNQ
ncbi:hypothetical protein [Fundidesulfovibrio agrisoli]|uniref:hypothetical protein n=1 Tax=Fundidesulfovibrio agrisoli TaxID=2922717 RepID=UPI001FAB9798|nr:hypothetical protein [Fundidesulfovibrio agrisoli]